MSKAGEAGRIRHCHPALPIGNAPVFVSPLRPFAAVRYLLGKGFVTAPNLLGAVPSERG